MSLRINNLKNIEICQLSDEMFSQLWGNFLENYPSYSYRYSREYIEVEKTQIKNDYVDLSFIVFKDNIPLCIFPLILDISKKYSWYNDLKPLPSPLFSPILEKKQFLDLEKILQEILINLIKKEHIKRLYVLYDPTTFYQYNFNEMFFDRFGAIDFSCFYSYVNLSLSNEQRWSKIRNSYKNIINKGLKTYKFNLYDNENINEKLEDIFKNMHIKCSGKQNRSDASYKAMFNLIRLRKAYLIEQVYENRIAQLEILALGKGSAIGASMTTDEDFIYTVPLTHSMNHSICNKLKERGFSMLETGYSNFSEDLNFITNDKVRNIRFFKRGFGNENYLLRKWIWFSSKLEEKKYYDEQLLKFKKNYDI